MPPYPYGPALQYKARDRGLYGGSTIQFGNNVSEKNKGKTRRTWHPNIHRKRLWSDALGKFVQVKVQARVLRTIDKVGGLDEYLLGNKPARIKELGVEGWRLRWEVMRTPKIRDRIKAERVKLGLPEGGWIEEVGPLDDEKQSGTVINKKKLVEEVERVAGDVVDELDAADGGNGRVVDVEGSTKIRGEDLISPSEHTGEVMEREDWRHMENEEERGSSKTIHRSQR